MRNLILVLVVLILGCHEQNKNKISPAELVKSREIKKVSEAEILKGATVMAEAITIALDSLVEAKLMDDSIGCKAERWAAVDSLANHHNADIRLIRKDAENLEQLEFQLLEAYQYNLENQLPMSPSVQKLDNKRVLYTAPLKQLDWTHCPDSSDAYTPRIWSMKLSVKEVIRSL